MQVLVISHMYPKPYNPAYGIFVHHQVKALQSLETEIRVVSPTPAAPWPLTALSGKWRGYSRVPARDTVEGVTVYYPRFLSLPSGIMYAASGHRAYRGLAPLLPAIKKEFSFHLIHAHTALPDGQAALLASQNLGVPYVVTVHGYDLQQVVHKGPSSRKALQQVIAGAGKVFLVSAKLLRLARHYFPEHESKFAVIPNGFDPKHVYTEKSPLADKYRGQRLIISVSNLVPVKGIEYNLKALARLIPDYPDLHYLIAGDGPERPGLEALTHKLKLDGHVTFLGRLHPSRVMEYLSFCHIFSLPSYNEAFGVAYLEAAAHGLPVVACSGQGIDGTLVDGETAVMVQPRDVSSLEAALRQLLDHPQQAKQMGEKARKKVLSSCTWQSVAETIKQEYVRLR